MESCPNKSYFENFSLDKISFENKNLDKSYVRGDNTYKDLGDDNDEKVQLRIEEHIFSFIWNNKANGYFWGIKQCDLLVIQKQQKQHIQNFE